MGISKACRSHVLSVLGARGSLVDRGSLVEKDRQSEVSSGPEYGSNLACTASCIDSDLRGNPIGSIRRAARKRGYEGQSTR